MKLEYIREFTVLARAGSFQRASAELRIAQGTLSKHMKLLEQEFGAPLLRRGHSRSVLTELGDDFLPTAQRMLEEYDRFAARRLGSDREELSIGLSRDASLYFPLLMERLVPVLGRGLRFRTGTRDELHEWMGRGICRFCFIVLMQRELPLLDDGLVADLLYRDAVAWVGPVSPDNQNWEIVIRSLPFLTGPAPLCPSLGGEFLQKEEDYLPPKPIYCEDPHAVPQLIQQGFGWSFLPLSAAQHLTDVAPGRVLLRPLPERYDIQLYSILRPSDSEAANALKALRRELTQWKSHTSRNL